MSSLGFMREVVKNNPVLSATEQLILVKKWQDQNSKPALDQLILSNMKIVSKEASRIKSRNYYISYEDLMQEGIAGLLKAASMFDTNQEVTFLTYAMWWIKANMKRDVMDYRSVVKMGTTRDDRTLFSNLSKTMREAEDMGLTGGDMLDYISSTLSVKKSSLHQMMASLKGGDVRLDTPVSSKQEGETTKLELMEDNFDYHKAFEEANELDAFSSAIKEILPSMPKLEREIVEGRFLTESPKTLRELESELNVSREWVRKVEIKALDRIRKRLRLSYGIEGAD